jgi:DNA-binding response OmpR family regulator
MKNILLIDDDAPLRSVLRLHLERLGYCVQEAGNGREGLKAYDTFPADIVFTDLIMPDMEGLETIREIRRRSAQVKILAFTGSEWMDSTGILAVAKKLGAQSTLRKPFTMKEVVAALQELGSDPSGTAPATP